MFDVLSFASTLLLKGITCAKMEKSRIIKVLFQLFAIGMFIYQMYNSVFKFVERPVVQLTSTIKFDDMQAFVHINVFKT